MNLISVTQIIYVINRDKRVSKRGFTWYLKMSSISWKR